MKTRVKSSSRPITLLRDHAQLITLLNALGFELASPRSIPDADIHTMTFALAYGTASAELYAGNVVSSRSVRILTSSEPRLTVMWIDYVDGRWKVDYLNASMQYMYL